MKERRFGCSSRKMKAATKKRRKASKTKNGRERREMEREREGKKDGCLGGKGESVSDHPLSSLSTRIFHLLIPLLGISMFQQSDPKTLFWGGEWGLGAIGGAG